MGATNIIAMQYLRNYITALVEQNIVKSLQEKVLPCVI